MLKTITTKYMGRDVLIVKEESRHFVIFTGIGDIRISFDVTNAVTLSQENYEVINMRKMYDEVVRIKLDNGSIKRVYGVDEIRITDLFKVQIGDSEVCTQFIENEQLKRLIAQRLIALFLITIPEADMPSEVFTNLFWQNETSLEKVISLISSNTLELICRAVSHVIKCGENHHDKLAHVYSDTLIIDYEDGVASQAYFTKDGDLFATDTENIFRLRYEYTPHKRLEFVKHQLGLVQSAAELRSLDRLNPNYKAKPVVEHESIIAALEATIKLLKKSTRTGVTLESLPTADEIIEWSKQCQ